LKVIETVGVYLAIYYVIARLLKMLPPSEYNRKLVDISKERFKKSSSRITIIQYVGWRTS
jgi:hypothetical protein